MLRYIIRSYRFRMINFYHENNARTLYHLNNYNMLHSINERMIKSIEKNTNDDELVVIREHVKMLKYKLRSISSLDSITTLNDKLDNIDARTNILSEDIRKLNEDIEKF